MGVGGYHFRFPPAESEVFGVHSASCPGRQGQKAVEALCAAVAGLVPASLTEGAGVIPCVQAACFWLLRSFRGCISSDFRTALSFAREASLFASISLAA